MNKTKPKYRQKVIAPAIRLSLVFFVVSALWSFFSERVLMGISVEMTHFVFWKMIVNWGFLLSLGLVFFFFVRHVLNDKYLITRSLSLSRSRYKTITEKTLTGIVIVNREGVVKYVNPAFCRIFNYRPKEVLEQHFRLLVAPKEENNWLKLHERFFQGYTMINGFYNVINKEAKELVVYVDAVLVESDDGEEQQLLFMNDVSAQHRAEHRLAESERRYRIMMESLHDAVIVSDNQGFILYSNNAFKQQFGNPPSNVPCYDFLFEGETVGPVGPDGNLLLTERFEIQVEDKKRGRVYRVTHVPLESFGSGFWGMTILQDLTEVIQAQRRAEESDRLKSAFLANMSHEIRTPLNSILGFSGLLVDKQITNEERSSFVSLINQSGNQLLKVIDNIIDYSFIESGNLKLTPGEIVIEDLVKQLMQFVHQHRDLYHKSEVEVFSTVSLPNGYSFVADFKRLKQVLINLLDNALKFTEQGNIHLEVSLSDNDLVFVISDTGIGISSEMQKIVFERFRQEDEALSRTFGGSGLGLSISQLLVELMGGSIEMVSEVGQGTHLKVQLPVGN